MALLLCNTASDWRWRWDQTTGEPITTNTNRKWIGIQVSEENSLVYVVATKYSAGSSSNKRKFHVGLYTLSQGGSTSTQINSSGTVTYKFSQNSNFTNSTTKTVTGFSPIWSGSSVSSTLYGETSIEYTATNDVNIYVSIQVSGGQGQYKNDTVTYSLATAEFKCNVSGEAYFKLPKVPSYTVNFDKYLDGSTYTGSDITLDRTSYTAYDTSSTTTCTTDTTNSAKYSFSGWFKGSNTSASWTAKTTGSINASSNSGSTYHAKWTTNKYTVSSTTYTNGEASTSGGNISINPVTVTHGGSTTLTATVNSGYRFLGWYSTSTGAIIGGSTDRLATTLSYTLSNVTSNTTLYPSFISRYTIETLTVPLAGGTVSGTTEVDRGGSTTLTATPNEHYEFIGWSIGYDDTAPTIFSNPLELTNITEDKFVFAYFMYLLSIKRRIISG